MSKEIDSFSKFHIPLDLNGPDCLVHSKGRRFNFYHDFMP